MGESWSSLLRETRRAVSALRRTRGAAAVAVASVALGVGANVAVFSVVDAVLLKPLPYAQPERLISIWETFPRPTGAGRGTVSVPNYLDWRAQTRSYSELGAWGAASHALTGEGTPSPVASVRVTPTLFAVLGRHALHGRTFGAAEAEPGGERAVVLAHGLWLRRFGGDPAIVGREIGLDGEPHRVVGVMPRDFQFPSRSSTDLWVPLVFSPGDLDSRGSHWLRVLGRLRPGVALAAATSELELVAQRLAREYPDEQAGRSVVLLTLPELDAEGRRTVLLALWGAVGLVLLIASANVANLLLARAASRRTELAVHAALGAGRWPLMRLVLAEAAVLAAAGGLAGLGLGFAAGRALARLPGSGLPPGFELRLDPRVVGFSLGVTLAAALLSGLPAALRASGARLRSTLAAGRSLGADSSRERLKAGLVLAEIGLATVVAVGAGLLLRTVERLQSVELGLEVERVATAQLRLPAGRYPENAERAAFYARLLDRLAELPQVEAVGLINVLPIQNWGWNGDFQIEGRPRSVGGEQFAEFRRASPGYFSALGIPRVAGRSFAPGDLEPDSPRAVLVNETFARTYWPRADPLGARLGLGRGEPDEWWTIVGVVGDVRQSGVHQPPRAEIYMPAPRVADAQMTLVVRSALEPAALQAVLERAVAAVDPDLPLHNPQTMAEVVDRQLAGWRFQRALFGALAALALALAAAGVYGLLAYAVAERTREIGVRLALGARGSQVIALVLRRGLGPALAGTLAGAAVGLAATRLLRSRLYEVSPADPATYLAAGALVLLVALAACWIPARRASTIDPLRALREE